ncbi:pre-rRNA processing protein [Vermiconidia calcicola]|uniref:Pre-rRNA processing protein n=1 Tax=Vermiconidia calcicola TaxID=1690605 RepID=A0ACC3N586_9PEZI|nr:pre-rRNA processing protein [Vermiconidia calcicola]
MSSFFTLPASQKKRKRSQPQPKRGSTTKRSASKDDESISGSDGSEDDTPGRPVEDGGSESEDDDDLEGEDVASKRIRLAEQYLANTQKEVLDDAGFDAADVDQDNLRRRMGDRLKEDTAESKGKLYRWMAVDLDWSKAQSKVLRSQNIQKCLTGVALQGIHVYAVSKDMHLVKWQQPKAANDVKGRRPSKKWKVVGSTRGDRKRRNAHHHHAAILCVAASQDGKFVVTGGADNKLIVWDAASLKPLKVFTHHRDSVTALAFRRGTNQLFSTSKDRTVKIWSLDELAYVETLFGHQDEVVDVSALGQEKCVTAGARDRTARLWKVVEESQLVFRGGGAPGTSKALETLRRAYSDDSGMEREDNTAYHEGSIDRIAMVDEDMFVTASDNGSLSLWNINKKKAVYTLPLAHGLHPALPLEQASAEQEPDDTLDEKGRGGKQPRWITALATIPFSDVIVTGSWDGYVRAWKISEDRRGVEPLGVVGAIGESVDSLLEKEGLSSDSVTKGALEAMRYGANDDKKIQGVINDLAVVEKGDRGKESVLIAAAIGKEHRLGRWKEVSNGRNHIVLLEVSRKTPDSDGEESNVAEQDGGTEDDKFEGFD